MSNKTFINELKDIYEDGYLVPFIGAGLSIPFSVPDWGNLIRNCAIEMGIKEIELPLLEMVEHNLEKYDYWEAVRLIKNYLNRSEEDIQQYVARTVNASINLDVDKSNHNYSDLSKMSFTSYITTNYDHILSEFLMSNFIPINLKDINSNIQNIVNSKSEKRIFHLHGHISDSSSIVLSHDKYMELYNDDKYKILFSTFTNTKTFLFIGFSFNDIFIQKIIKENYEAFKVKHYIVLDRPTAEQIVFLKSNFNLETISYDSHDSSHVEEIRKILLEISELKNDAKKQDLVDDFMDELIEVLPDLEKKRELEKNLFCQKLRLENIKENKIDYSKDCFFTAEQYIRWLKKSGIKNNEKIITHMLHFCYLKYKDLLIQVYEGHKNSDEFLQSVHNALSILNFNHVEKFLDKNMPNEANKKGFIHLVADDEKSQQPVWWGEKRFDK